MKKYDTYKDSGIEWLGEIPEHWILTKLKYYLSVQSGIGIKNSEVIENGEFPIYGGNGIMGWTDKSNSTGEVLIIGRVGALCGNIHIVNDTIWISDNALWGKSFQNQKYLFYFLKFLDLNRFANKNAQPLITGTIVKVQEIGLPTLPEQDIIASFLDHKTTQIDTLIEKKEQLVEKLTLKRQAIINEAVTKGLNPDVPMKDSGIEWLGEIPEHWEISKLNYISDVYGGATPKSNVDNYWGGNINWITPDDLGKIQGKSIVFSRRTITESGLLSCSASVVPKGSIVLSSRAPIGHIGILEVDACTNQGCKAFVPNEKVQNYFLYYYLLSAKTDLQSLGTGSTFLEISTAIIKNYRIALPPYSEQISIVSFLENKTTQLTSLIEKINTSIEKLKLYRQSLISEAVTGKIDLRDWKQPSD